MEFKCNSMNTVIVLIVSIKFEELTRKDIGFETLNITFFFGIGNNKLYSCLKSIVRIGR